jgi:NAD(P)-dependent dehydrogenase (short-subunit alcohol dehydrogenase family)
MKFKDKIMIITGGCTGIGGATAELFSDKGTKVYVLDVKDEVGKKAEHYTYITCNVAKAEEVKKCVQQVIEKEGRVDLLFCNAGVHYSGTIEQTSWEKYREVLDINLSGVFYTLKEVLPHMRKQKYGKVVIMGSDQSKIGKAGSAIYGATKGALGQLTKSTAIDYAQHNINVNCVCPGTIDTPLVDKVLEKSGDAEGVKKFLKEAQPIHRLGKAEEVAHMVAYLCSDEAGYVTGALFSIDGGYTAQ